MHWKDWSWSWSSSILVIWCKQTTHWKKSLMLGKIEGTQRRGHLRMRWLDSITDAINMNLGKLREMCGSGRPGLLQSLGSQTVKHKWVTEQQQQQLTSIHGNLCVFFGDIWRLLPNFCLTYWFICIYYWNVGVLTYFGLWIRSLPDMWSGNIFHSKCFTRYIN